MTTFQPDATTILAPKEAAEALLAAWMTIFGRSPTIQTLATLWAQTAFETGRFTSMHCFNWGNIRKIMNPDDEHNWCQYVCSEYKGNVLTKYYPPDTRCSFRAYSSAASGALDYLITLSKKPRYSTAWKVLEDGGTLEAFVHALKVGDGTPNSGGYFTDREEHYLAGVKHYYDEFMVKHYSVLPSPSLPPPIPQEIPKVLIPMLHRVWIPKGKNFFSSTLETLKNFMARFH